MTLFNEIVTIIIVCTFGSGQALTRRRASAHLSADPTYVHMTVHKSGTALANSLGGLLASTLNTTFHETNDLNYILFTPCVPGAVAMYDDLFYDVKKRDIEVYCPNERKVHFLRRPSDMVVSSYIYTKHLVPGDMDYDQFFGIMGGNRADKYVRSPVSDGLKEECRQMLLAIELMVWLHEDLQQHRKTNVLEVRFEDFQHNYDKTTRTVFEHHLGSTDSRVNLLVEKAKAFDVNRWNESQTASYRHISDSTEKYEAAMEAEKLVQAGDSCMRRIVGLDRRLGYDYAPFEEAKTSFAHLKSKARS